jgi:hypothetical protein
MNILKTINYRKFKINIIQDELYNSEMLNEDDDIFLLYYHRDFWVTKKGFEKQPSKEMLNDWLTDYHFIPVYAYIHSGVALSLGNSKYPFNDQWDVSCCGCILIDKKCSDFEIKENRDKAAQAMIDEWNSVLSGEVYGYQIYSNDEEIDSCWGYVGNYEKSGIIEETKSIVDYEINRNAEKYAVQLEFNI